MELFLARPARDRASGRGLSVIILLNTTTHTHTPLHHANPDCCSPPGVKTHMSVRNPEVSSPCPFSLSSDMAADMYAAGTGKRNPHVSRSCVPPFSPCLGITRRPIHIGPRMVRSPQLDNERGARSGETTRFMVIRGPPQRTQDGPVSRAKSGGPNRRSSSAPRNPLFPS